MTNTFAEVRGRVPSIHAWAPGDGVTILYPSDRGAKRDSYRYRLDHITGNGSRETPFTCDSPADVSSYDEIVKLWLRRNESPFTTSAASYFIKVKDWLFRVEPDGVTAEDGHFPAKVLKTNFILELLI